MKPTACGVIALTLVSGVALHAEGRWTGATFGGSGTRDTRPSGGRIQSWHDTITAVTLDRSGNVYLAGTTYSTNFPQIRGFQPNPSTSCQGDCEYRALFVAKASGDLKTFYYRAYVGAPSSPARVYVRSSSLLPAAIAVDDAGNAYVAGQTSGENFPVAGGGARSLSTAGKTDAFILKLDANGNVRSSLLIGGAEDDAVKSIALGPNGTLFVAGTTNSLDFPRTTGAYSAPLLVAADPHVFVTKIKPDNTVAYSAIPGDTSREGNPHIKVTADGVAVLAVSSSSASWPATPGAIQSRPAGSHDIVIARLSASGDRLASCTYLGGADSEIAVALALDNQENALVAGRTKSRNFPGLAGRQGELAGGFAAKLNPLGTKMHFSTSVGPSFGSAAFDAQGNIYIGGGDASDAFPLKNAVQAGTRAWQCAEYTLSGMAIWFYKYCHSAGWARALNAATGDVIWSTTMGFGVVHAFAADSAGRIYAAGRSLDPMHVGMGTASVVRFDPKQHSLQFALDSIVNAASFRPGVPHPGGLATIFLESPEPSLPDDFSIFVGGERAPVLGIADAGGGRFQVNFQVPFEAQSASIVVWYKGNPTFAQPEVVGPGIFTLPNGQAAIQHADYTMVTVDNPARAGEVVIVYATSFGRVQPSVRTGEAASGPATLNPGCSIGMPPKVQASIGTVEYAGIAPGFPGLYQVNVRLPGELTPGPRDFSLTWPECWPFYSWPPNFAGSNKVTLYVQ